MRRRHDKPPNSKGAMLSPQHRYDHRTPTRTKDRQTTRSPRQQNNASTMTNRPSSTRDHRSTPQHNDKTPPQHPTTRPVVAPSAPLNDTMDGSMASKSACNAGRGRRGERSKVYPELHFATKRVGKLPSRDPALALDAASARKRTHLCRSAYVFIGDARRVRPTCCDDDEAMRPW